MECKFICNYNEKVAWWFSLAKKNLKTFHGIKESYEARVQNVLLMLQGKVLCDQLMIFCLCIIAILDHSVDHW